MRVMAGADMAKTLMDATRRGLAGLAQPGATATHAIDLLELIKKRVFEHCGLHLEEEVDIWRRGDGGQLQRSRKDTAR